MYYLARRRLWLILPRAADYLLTCFAGFAPPVFRHLLFALAWAVLSGLPDLAYGYSDCSDPVETDLQFAVAAALAEKN